MSGKDSVIKSFIGYLSHLNNKLIHLICIFRYNCVCKIFIYLTYNNIASCNNLQALFKIKD